MHASIERLLSVQEVDSQMIFLREAARMRPLELQDEQRKLDGARAQVEAVVGQIKELRKTIDGRELDVKSFDADVGKLNVSLNQAKTNAEFSVLKEQIRRQEESRDEVEEEILSYLSELEALEAKQKDLDDRRAVAESAFERKSKDVAEVLDGLHTQIAELEAKRENLSDGVDPEHVGIYEKVLARYNDFAIAHIDGQVCQGCHMAVTPQELNLLLQNEFLQCRTCYRLMYSD